MPERQGVRSNRSERSPFYRLHVLGAAAVSSCLLFTVGGIEIGHAYSIRENPGIRHDSKSATSEIFWTDVGGLTGVASGIGALVLFADLMQRFFPDSSRATKRAVRPVEALESVRDVERPQ